MNEGIREEGEILREQVVQELRENKGRLKLSEKSIELFSKIFHFREKNKIRYDELSELIGVSAFRLYYLRQKMFGPKSQKRFIRMKRVKIVDIPLETKDVRVKTPKGFEIFFSTPTQAIEFIRAFL